MSVALYTTVLVGSTVRISAVIKDFDGATLINPSSHSLTFYNPSMVLQGAAVTSPVPDGTGTFHYDYTIPSTGMIGLWTMYWSIVAAGTTSIEDTQFNVVSK